MFFHLFFVLAIVLQRAEMSCTSARWSWATRKWASAPKMRWHCGRENWQPRAERQSHRTRRRCITLSAKVNDVYVCRILCVCKWETQVVKTCIGVPLILWHSERAICCLHLCVQVFPKVGGGRCGCSFPISTGCVTGCPSVSRPQTPPTRTCSSSSPHSSILFWWI